MRASAKGMVVAVHAGRCPALESVLDDVRRRLGNHPGFSFPRRVITKPVAPGDELHQTVTPAQFEELRRSGQFCCLWSDGARNFALPKSVADDLAEGRRVVVAGGDGALPALCELAESVTLIRLLRPGEEPEAAPVQCETEVLVTVTDNAEQAATALQQQLLSLKTERPGRRSEARRPIPG